MSPSTTQCCAILLALSSIASAPTQKAQTSQKDISRELQRLYDEDHQDQDEWSDENEDEFDRRQTVRRDRVLEILAAGMLGPIEDWSNAAWLLQHGHRAEDYSLAHALSGPPFVQRLTLGGFACAATLDRFLESIERTEIFSTQTYTEKPYPAEAFGAYPSMPDSIRRLFTLDPVAKDAEKPGKGAAKELSKLLKLAQAPGASADASAGVPEWLARARGIVTAGGPESEKDYFAAAQILLRSPDANDLLMSHVCALAAALLKHKEGLSLSAEAFDRFLLAVQRPQIFGTVPGESGDPLEPCQLAPEVIRKGYGLALEPDKKSSK